MTPTTRLARIINDLDMETFQNHNFISTISVFWKMKTGLDLLQAIRHRYIDLPVILCTAYPAFAHDLKSAAADYYLVKSSDLGELKLKVEMAMNGRAQVLESGKREGTIGADPFVSVGTE